MTHPTNTPEQDRELREQISILANLLPNGPSADALVAYITAREERLAQEALLQDAYWYEQNIRQALPVSTKIIGVLLDRIEAVKSGKVRIIAQLTPETKPEKDTK